MLRSTYPFFFFSVFWIFASSALAQDQSAPALTIDHPLKMTTPEKTEAGSTMNPANALAQKTPRPPPVVRDQRVLDAAKMYEKYFLGQMMKAMRSTVNKSELEKQSMGEGIYREQLDDQYVDSWGDRGGIGLADMIHDELVGKAEMMKMRRQAMRAAHGKVRTPMALTDRDVLKVRRLPGVKNEQDGATVETVLVSLGKTTARAEDGPESVRSPWAGKIRSISSENGKALIGLETEKTASEASRQVEVAFDGVPFQVTEGDVVRAGQAIGQLGKAARGILLRQTLVQEALKSPVAKIGAVPGATLLPKAPGPEDAGTD